MTLLPKRLPAVLRLLCCLFLLFSGKVIAESDGHAHRKKAPADATPYLKFIPQQGQWKTPTSVQYRSDLIGGRVWLRPDGFTFVYHDLAQLDEIHETYYHGEDFPRDRRIDDEVVDLHAFALDFIGTAPHPDLQATGPSSAYYNYFLGNDASRWQARLRAYDQVHYRGLYAGIDMAVYSLGNHFKYDLIVQPGADPHQIRLIYTGTDELFLKDGDLHLRTSVRALAEMKPYAYQRIDGRQVEVPVHFVLNGNEVTFALPEGFDPAHKLVIDPTLVGATYSGSTASCYGHSATYDDAGNIYAAGICFGVGFPTTTGAYQTNFAGGSIDMAVNKYNPDATALLWSTYIGGSAGSDYPHSMIVNDLGELTVFGSTSSNDYPLSTNAVDQVYAGTSEIAITHLNATATGIIGSTFLGGSSDDGRNQFPMTFNYGDTYRGEVIVDGAQNIYIASVTSSNDFPTTTGAFQSAFGGGQTDGVIAKLNPSLSTLIWSSYIGGTAEECANSLKLNASGDVYVTGGTSSGIDFPTTSGAFQTTYQGGSADGYLLRIAASGASVLQGSYVGTASDDQGYFVEIDASDEPYILGQCSAGYPVSPSVYSQTGGELFIHKFNSTISASQFSTVLGDGTSNLSPTAFLVDVCGNIYAAAWGNTSNLPVTPNAFQSTGSDDFYLVTLQPNASGLLYATKYGGSGWEHVDGGTSRFDKQGIVYEASCSNSTNWPVTPGAVYPNSTNSTWDVVCFKFDFDFIGIAAAFASAGATNGCAPFPVTFTNNSSQGANTYYLWDFGTGDTDTAMTPTYTYQQAGTYTVTLIVTDSSSCAGADTATLQVVITAAPPLILDQDTTFCFGDSIQLTSPVIPGATYAWTPPAGLSNPGISNPMAFPGQTTTYTLTVTDSGGCESSGNIDLEVIAIAADAGPLTTFCEGEGGTQLQAATPSGGTQPYYYTWWCDTTTTAFCGLDSTFDDDPIANPDSTTWYYLQVQDANGCLSEIDSALVEVLPKPVVDAGPDVGICPPPGGGSVLSASVLNQNDVPGPYTVQWLPNTGLVNANTFTPYARPDTTTIYVALVTAGNGCTSEATTVDTTSSVTVTVHPQPIAEAGPEIHTCLGDTTVLQGVGSGAGPDYRFEWSPSTGLSDTTIANPVATLPFTHQYTLTVWSNGCPSIGDTTTVWVHTLPTPSAGPIREICLGESVELDAFGAGDSTASYTYQWSPGASLSDSTAENPQASPVSTTQYELIVTSSWGCESPVDTVQVTVKPTPIAEAGPEQTLCAGDSLALNGGYYYTTTDSADPSQIYYTWTPAQDIDDPTAQSPLVWPEQSGWYHLNVQHNTCDTQDSVLVVVIPEILPLVSLDTSVTCAGDSVQLHADGGLGGATFTWSPAQGLDDPTAAEPWAAPDRTTVYTVTMNESGCLAQGQVSLEIIPRPDVAFLHSAPSGCAPLTVSFLDNSTDAIQYIWNFGDGSPVSNETTPTHIYAQAGSFPVTLTAVNTGGCAAQAPDLTVRVTDPVAADFNLAPVSHPGQTGTPLSLQLPATGVNFRDLSRGEVVTWRWDFGDDRVSQDQHPVHQYRTPGEYYVTLLTTNAEGCVSRVVHGPIIVQTPDLFIPNVFSPNEDDINDQFFVEYSGSQPFRIQVFDRWGVLLHETTNKLQGWDGLDAQGNFVPSGVYYYNVRVGDQEYVGPVTLVR